MCWLWCWGDTSIRDSRHLMSLEKSQSVSDSVCYCLLITVNIQIHVIKTEEVFSVLILKFCWICLNFLIAENEDKDETASDVEETGDSGKTF